MKTFVTLFNVENVHLIKDVGLIPYGLNKYGYYNAKIATYNNGPYENIDNNTITIPFDFIKKITGFFAIDSILYLIKNAKKIDILNIYHSTFRSMFFIIVYKLFNRRGFVYCKLDGGFTKEETPIYKSFRKYVISHSDLLSTEMKFMQSKLARSWKRDISLLRNPFNLDEIQRNVTCKNKKNIILTVGRLGTYQKNTEILINAFSQVYTEIPNWQLVLVGPYTNNLKEMIDLKLADNSSLNGRIILEGNKENRDELLGYYKEAKVFVMPSRYESYGIALQEAALFDDYILCSNIPQFKELTKNFTLASSFDFNSQAELQSLLISTCANIDKCMQTATLEKDFLLNECSLRSVSQHLYNEIEKLEIKNEK